MIGAGAFSKWMKPPCEDLAQSELGIKYPKSHSSPFLSLDGASTVETQKAKGKGSHTLWPSRFYRKVGMDEEGF